MATEKEDNPKSGMRCPALPNRQETYCDSKEVRSKTQSKMYYRDKRTHDTPDGENCLEVHA